MVLLLHASTIHVRASNETDSGSDLGSSVGMCAPIRGTEDVGEMTTTMKMFPPAGNPDEPPVTVHVNSAMIQVDAIHPHLSTWSMRSRAHSGSNPRSRPYFQV